jgi:hypothetical protein
VVAGVGVDLGSLTAEQLRIYAAGYTDALTDTAPERAELVAAARAVAELEQARALAEQIYHDAYCDCRQHVVTTIFTADRIRAARAEHQTQQQHATRHEHETQDEGEEP